MMRRYIQSASASAAAASAAAALCVAIMLLLLPLLADAVRHLVPPTRDYSLYNAISSSSCTYGQFCFVINKILWYTPWQYIRLAYISTSHGHCGHARSRRRALTHRGEAPLNKYKDDIVGVPATLFSFY